MNKKQILEIAAKIIVAALTAFITALTTTSCMGYGPIAFWETKMVHFWKGVSRKRNLLCAFVYKLLSEQKLEVYGLQNRRHPRRVRRPLKKVLFL